MTRDNEDRMMNLLTIVKCRQIIVKQQTEVSEQREKARYQAFTTLFQRMVDEHNALHARYQHRLKEHSSCSPQLPEREFNPKQMAAGINQPKAKQA